jgi:hypothetical protein
MSHPEVRAALSKRLQARKRFYRAKERGRDAEGLAAAQTAMNVAHREWQQARDAAYAKTTADLLSRIDHGGTSHFFRRYQSARGAKRRVPRINPHLDATATAAFWQGIFTNQAPDVSERPAYCADPDVEITDAMVSDAIKQMSRKCAGPDGLDFSFFAQFRAVLSPLLALCFTRALARGVPAGLRQALTLLFPKGTTLSADPSEYRPITLLCMVIRILHKVLDNLFRAEMTGEGKSFSFQRTQAGFLPDRHTYEQATLLHLIQAVHKEAHGVRKLLCGIFLDIRKAYDSMEYSHLLDILESKHHFSKSWLEILRKFLPGNTTKIMGIEVYLRRGLPQGGALCPFLCDAFMDELACDLADHFDRHPRFGPLWRHSRSQRNHRWDQPWVKSLWLRLLQFADDIGMLASSPAELQELLDFAGAWCQRRGLEISPKSFAVLLSTPPGAVALPPLSANGVQIPWHPVNQPFRYLGVTTQSALSHRFLGGRTRADLKIEKVKGCLGALRRLFRVARRQQYVVPMALRLGIEQVVYAGALYDTAIVDTDYSRLDRMVTQAVAQIMQAPPTVPSAFVRWEFRLWHAELRAHKRTMQLCAHLWHHAWMGEEILEQYYLEHIDHPDPHPIFDIGPLARMQQILKEYGYSWPSVRDDLGYKSTEQGKSELSDTLTQKVLPAFAARVSEQALATRGMPEEHSREMLEHMGVVPQDEQRDGLPLPAHVSFDLPLYLCIDGDLPRAGFWMRMPYLRLQFRGDHPRAPCAWCGLPSSEYGYHLMRCTRMPASLRRRRDAVLRDILADARRAKQDPPDQWETPTSHANLMRLLHLYWPAVGKWKKGAKKGPSRRRDWQKQPDQVVLTKALWYMRATINAYSEATAGTGRNGSNPVWQLPVYGLDPYAEEGGPGPMVADRNMQPPSSQDSLWLLGSPEEAEAGEPIAQAQADVAVDHSQDSVPSRVFASARRAGPVCC